MLTIKQVQKNGVASELGFEKGDSILAFNGFKVIDVLDYTYYDAQTNFNISVLTKTGEEVLVEVEKYEDESLGLVFENDGLEIRTCHNNCLFCFVAQMPKGMRDSLYVKDDDYRQSFLCGNFVTLTNLSDQELERIIRLNLSPLYVSVHTMNGDLRNQMLSNRFAYKIEEQLNKLSKGNIQVHAQIVLVKGVNDGAELDYTIDKLYSIPCVQTCAVVPCGITKYREGLYPIQDLTKEYALQVIAQVQKANERNKGNLVALADEFYFKGGVNLPSYSSYGEFVQIENGVGMSVKFERDVEELIALSKTPLLKPGRYLTFSGTSAHAFISSLAKKVQDSCKGVTITVVAIENSFFGSTVNCTGLLVGRDIITALKPYASTHDCLLVPNPCLMQFSNVFLDNLTFNDLEKELGIKVKRASICS